MTPDWDEAAEYRSAISAAAELQCRLNRQQIEVAFAHGDLVLLAYRLAYGKEHTGNADMHKCPLRPVLEKVRHDMPSRWGHVLGISYWYGVHKIAGLLSPCERELCIKFRMVFSDLNLLCGEEHSSMRSGLFRLLADPKTSPEKAEAAVMRVKNWKSGPGYVLSKRDPATTEMAADGQYRAPDDDGESVTLKLYLPLDSDNVRDVLANVLSKHRDCAAEFAKGVRAAFQAVGVRW